jgi:lysozyme family protein
MSHDLDEALNYLLAEEGGWSNNEHDHGGATMYGVTQGTYDQYRRNTNKSPASVKNITKDEARNLYNTMYWKAAGCDKLPWPISYITFDAAVNSGPGRAVKWMQSGLGVAQDGAVGPGTVAAANKAVADGNGNVLLSIIDARTTFLARLVQKDASQATFLLGWWRRTLRVLARALMSEIPED